MADEKNLELEPVAEEAPTTEAKAEKGAKSSKKKGPGMGKRIAKYFRDLKGEFKKVTWPTWPSVVRNTLVVLAVCIILGLLITAVDLGLGSLVDVFLSLKG